MVEKNLELTRRWFEEVWNQQKTEAIHEMMAAECVSHNTSDDGEVLHGPQAFAGLQRKLLDAFPNIQIVVEEAFGAGDMVAARWSATMHHKGEGLGMLPTGAEIHITGMSMARIRDGKIIENWDEWDKLGMFQKIDAARAKAANG
jgi:predicted ester cyclase